MPFSFKYATVKYNSLSPKLLQIWNIDDGNYNTAIGVRAFYHNENGNENTAVGDGALHESTGSYNTAIGRDAGYNITSGESNIMIGRSIYAPSATDNYQLNIGNLIFGTDVDGIETTISYGNIGIGTTTPGYRLQVGNSGDGSTARANAWQTFSDRSLKRDLSLIDDPIHKIEQVSGYYYYWKDGDDKSRQTGVIAQEVEEVLPEIVQTDAEGIKSLDYSKLTPLLIEAVKEQQSYIEDLENRLSVLEKQIIRQ